MCFERKPGFYEKYIKRLLDILFSMLFIILFCWLYAVIAAVVWIKMGQPVIFKQPRPGIIKNGQETIFNLYKFRTMSDARDKNGDLLPDGERLSKFGMILRNTSLEGNDIIGQTTESLVNKGFREVSPIHFFTGRDLFSKKADLFDIEGGMNLLALNQGQEAFRAA